MQYGYRIIEDMIEGMQLYLSSHGYQSVSEIIGKASEQIIPAENLNRDSICYPKFNRSKCLGCGRCYLSCYDGGHQALEQDVVTGKPIMNAKKCVGCHLCVAVCPVQAISQGARVVKL
jgi:dihydropyrimidine dehydrogenase (NAD+) subunit PreA